MVDVSEKAVTAREAIARASVRMTRATRERLGAGDVPKGDVWAAARLAGIQAAKRTHELVPLCHAIALASVEVDFELDPDGERVHVRARAKARDRTGVEMEALVAASIAALTLYDMLKALDRAMSIEKVELLEKHGGRSGSFVRS
jgi:cyclic pyranopterin phosphate synthase